MLDKKKFAKWARVQMELFGLHFETKDLTYQRPKPHDPVLQILQLKSTVLWVVGGAVKIYTNNVPDKKCLIDS